jgi:alcohol dehydrogenase
VGGAGRGDVVYEDAPCPFEFEDALRPNIVLDSEGSSRTERLSLAAVDLSDPQLEAAREYGADVTLNPERDDVSARIEALTDGWGADVALECSGSTEAMQQALEVVGAKHGYETGTVVSIGIQTDPIEVGYSDIREGSLSVSGDHTRSELADIFELLGSGRVDISPSITHRLPLTDINDAIPLMTDTDERVGRIVIDTT